MYVRPEPKNVKEIEKIARQWPGSSPYAFLKLRESCGHKMKSHRIPFPSLKFRNVKYHQSLDAIGLVYERSIRLNRSPAYGSKSP
jgi:hypothetical protein